MTILATLSACRTELQNAVTDLHFSCCVISDDGQPIRSTLEDDDRQEIERLEKLIADVDGAIGEAKRQAA